MKKNSLKITDLLSGETYYMSTLLILINTLYIDITHKTVRTRDISALSHIIMKFDTYLKQKKNYKKINQYEILPLT